jgi:hypothetical protein
MSSMNQPLESSGSSGYHPMTYIGEWILMHDIDQVAWLMISFAAMMFGLNQFFELCKKHLEPFYTWFRSLIPMLIFIGVCMLMMWMYFTVGSFKESVYSFIYSAFTAGNKMLPVYDNNYKVIPTNGDQSWLSFIHSFFTAVSPNKRDL